MSRTIAYLARHDRGCQAAALRFTSGRREEVWSSSDVSGDPVSRIQAAALWLEERLAACGSARHLSVLCMDVDGALCAWLSLPGSRPEMVQAAVRQAGGHSPGGFDPAADGGAGATVWALEDVGGPSATLQPLAAPPAVVGKSQRIATMTLPDTSVKLLVDRLDDRRVRIDHVVSFWQAMGLAWDPGGPGGRVDGSTRKTDDRVVASSGGGVTAILLVDAGADRTTGERGSSARLVWAWSREGELLAAGTVRLSSEVENARVAIEKPDAGTALSKSEGAREAETSGYRVQLADHDLARLSADWLSWSAQIGETPDRLMALVTPSTTYDVIATEGPTGPEGLGAALRRAVPGASVDVVALEDPVAETLDRLTDVPLEKAVESTHALVDPLTRRPGRAHRALYRWSTLAACVAAIALWVLAFRYWGSAGAARDRAEAIRQDWIEEAASVAPAAMMSPDPLMMLQSKYREMTMGSEGEARTARPILGELSAIALVLGAAAGDPTIEIEVTEISLGSMISVVVEVPDAEVGESLGDALGRVGGSTVVWAQPELRAQAGGDRIRATYQGTWPIMEARPSGPLASRRGRVVPAGMREGH